MVNASALIEQSKAASEKSMNVATPKQKISYSKNGINLANDCVKFFPKEVGCYYYRAVNTGLYYETVGIGYQKGLKKMIKDLKAVINLDDSYEEGGAYQILGNIYLHVPSFSLSKNSVTKNINKAYVYAKKAMKKNPQNLENRFLLAEVLVEMEENEKAYEYLVKLKEDYPKKPSLNWHDKKNIKKIKSLLLKTEKQLTNKK